MEYYPKNFSGHVLFVCSGNKKGVCAPAITEQARAFQQRGVEVSFFKVKGKGLKGYARAVWELKYFLRKNNYDVIHAHYGLSGIVAAISGAKPLVVSLMGSDVFGPLWIFALVKFFARRFWPVTIVKSKGMARKIGKSGLHVIPNGVDMDLFHEMSREEARQRCGLSSSKIVLWPADPDRPVKNFELAEQTMKAPWLEDAALIIVYGVKTRLMPYYYNAADVVLVTSKWEGSPNVVKEALACNVPVVSTPVGDVKEQLKGIEGCAICEANPLLLANAVERALKLNARPKGRSRIKELDNHIVVRKILTLYQNCIEPPHPNQSHQKKMESEQSHGIKDYFRSEKD